MSYFTLKATKPVYHFNEKDAIISFHDKKSAEIFKSTGKYKKTTKIIETKTQQNIEYGILYKNIEELNESLAKLKEERIDSKILYLKYGVSFKEKTNWIYPIYSRNEECKFKNGDTVYCINGYGSYSSNEIKNFFGLETYQLAEYGSSNWKNLSYIIVDNCIINDITVYLCKNDDGYYMIFSENGISILNLADYKKGEFNALEYANLGKWSTEDDLKKFPSELKKYYYDKNQNAQFGSAMTRATISYSYIDNKFSKNGNKLFIGWTSSYDGGCSLAGKDVVSWEDLKTIFPDTQFA